MDHRAPPVANALAVLQTAAYEVEADLIGCRAIPPLHESPEDIAGLELSFLAVVEQGVLVAALGYRVDDDVLDIDRLMVHPDHARKGLASGLVATVLRTEPQTRAVVSTARENIPARRLYEQAGFEHLDDVEAVPGLFVSRYERLQRIERSGRAMPLPVCEQPPSTETVSVAVRVTYRLPHPPLR